MGAIMGWLVSSTGGGGYLKLLVSGAIILICVAGGVYLGDAIVRQPERSPGPAELAPALNLGDLFPLATFSDSEGNSGDFDSLLMGHKTILLYLSSDCSRCIDQLDFWNKEIAPILDSNVQTVICVPDNQLPPLFSKLIGRRMTITPDKVAYTVVGLKLTPTIVGLDEFGLAVFIQPGYTEFLGRDFYEHFAMTAK